MIKYIVVHCADTPNARDVRAADIHRWHKERGWSGIGYNAVITRRGDIEAGRPSYWAGAHVRDFDGDGEGSNSDSIGICLIGRDQFTDQQMVALECAIGEYLRQFPMAEVVGHRDLDSRKTCPNFDAKAWWANRHEAPKKPERLR